MRVVQVLYSGLGGHASVSFSLIEGDKENNWQHQLIFYGIEKLNKAYEEKAKKENIIYEFIQSKPGRPWKSWISFYRSLKKMNADIVLLHSVSLILPTYIYCKIYNKKLVSVEHTSNQVKRKVDFKISWLCQRLAHHVILLTDLYAKELTDRLKKGFRPNKNTIISNGINTNLFTPTSDPERTEKVKIGMAGRFTNARDQALLVEVLYSLNNLYSKKMELHLAGEGETMAMVKHKVKELKMEEKVFFLNTLSEAQMIDFFGKLTIYTQASFGETMSTAIMQAMACGLPVVASNIGGINNLIHNEKTGILVNHSLNGFIAGIKPLLESNEYYRNIGNAAREYAEEHFTDVVMFEKYNNLLRTLGFSKNS